MRWFQKLAGSWRAPLIAGALMVATSSSVAAQNTLQSAEESAAASPGFDFANLLNHTLMALVFGLIGMALFGLCIFLIARICPFSIRKEIEEDQNTALGIIVGAMILGIAMIISAAIVG